MPIYEFYCADCHTLFNFFSFAVNTEARPLCPRCRRVRLERRPARFATLKHRGEEEPDPLGRMDEERLGGVMESMLEELGDFGEDENPAKLAQLFRRFGEGAGMELGPRMEEYLRRLEGGEDPDQIDEEMGDAFDDDQSMEEFFRFKKAATSWRARRPRVDEEMYFL